jgi:hypothetical protein
MQFCIAILTLFLAIPAVAGKQRDGRKKGTQDDLPGSSASSQEPKDRNAPQQKKADDMQGTPGMGDTQMPGMEMGGNEPMTMHPETFEQEIVRHAGSGTSAEPNSTPVPMLMRMKNNWSLMFHANGFLVEEQQSGPRGADKFYSTNWFMGMVQRRLGPGAFTTRAMLSLEPATVTGRQYPLLFQQGETAFGKPIVDGQHPHNFVMEIAALYDVKWGKSGLISFYAAPVGDPALGPPAYPHRASASENPLAALGHHQEDSTHIAANVVTAGVAYRLARIEASGFHGREPDENRWTVSQGKIDSWSVRLTLQPGKDWSGQFSYGRIVSPEAVFPSEKQARMTASVMYNRPFHNGNWASSLIWGRTNSLEERSVFNSYTLESTVRFLRFNHAWTRIENADRSNELLLGENPLPPNFQERPIGRIQAYTLGYDRDFDLIPHVATALGAQVTVYGVANSLKPVYGPSPAGGAVFIRFRPFSANER